MAKITIQGLPPATNFNLPYTYADLHLDIQQQYLINDPLHKEPEINDIKVDYDLDAIKNSIKNIFYTTPGNKILAPTFGLDLRRFCFEPATLDTAYELQRLIYTELETFEPRIKLIGVSVLVDEDNNEFDITIVFSIPTLNIDNILIAGSLNSNGYNYT